MKSGRPSFHIPASWIVISIPGKERVAFKLDKKGNAIKKNGTIQPDPTFDFKRADEQRLAMQLSLPKPKRTKNAQSSSVISQPMTPITQYSQYHLPINSQGPNSTTMSVLPYNQPMDMNIQPTQSRNIPNTNANLPNPPNQMNYIQQNNNSNSDPFQNDHFFNSDNDDFLDIFPDWI